MMCARMLRHKPESEQGWFYRTSEHAFNAVIAFYGKTLRWVLRHRVATLCVAIGTLVTTVWLYILVPKGFFRSGYRILGISEAPQTVSFAAMVERQQALARVILQDQAVKSLSSFIGVDGTNDHQQRAHPDQLEAARRAASVPAILSGVCNRACQRGGHYALSCSRCRT